MHTVGECTVNPEIFARTLISRMALKDIFATFKFRDEGMIKPISVLRQNDFSLSRGFYFHETSHMRSFAK